MSTINRVDHGLVAGQRVRFSSINPSSGTGVDPAVIYYVISAGLAANTFQISETAEGTPVTILLPIVSANMEVVPETTDAALAFTAAAATDLITTVTAHGYVAGDTVVLLSLTGGTGLAVYTLYYVLAAGLTTTAFKVALTAGGVAIDITVDATAGYVTKSAVYTAITDPTDVMAPPTTPATPTNLAWTSAVNTQPDGTKAVRITMTIDAATDPQTRAVVVTFVGSGNPIQVTLAPTQTSATIESVIGNLSYSATAVAYDVYGNASAATAAVVHTTAKDLTAPAQPTGLVVSAIIAGVQTDWTANTELDFAYYELQICSNNAFTAPTLFTFKLYTNSFPVTPLVYSGWYARVRAVDTSGNASAYSATSGPITPAKVGTADLAATAVINQATNLINTGATVTIDATGATILNGKLALQDEFGKSVLVASGFSGSWRDFVATGLYNSAFKSGTAGVIPTGRTSALPYWTVSDIDAGGVLTFLNPGVKFTWGATSDERKMLSDIIPILPGQTYELAVAYDVTRVAGQIDMDVSYTTWDSTLTFSSTLIAMSLTHTANRTFIIKKTRFTAGTTDHYVQVGVSGRELTAHNAGNLLNVWGVKLNPVPGPVTARNVYTAGATWTKPSNLLYIEVECVGSGGGGGGVAATAAAQGAAAGGGGGGGYAKKIILASSLPDSCTVTVGAGGAGGAAGANNGTAGNASSFAGTGITTVQGNGGAAGSGGAAAGVTTVNGGGGGGTATGGDINVQGGSGGNGIVAATTRLNSGYGGSTAIGGSQRGNVASAPGFSGFAYGGGGTGAVNDASQASTRAGGTGADGVVIVTEHYN